jgi:hypothetical protein
MIGFLEFSYPARRRINRFVWRPLRQLAEVVHPVPALSAFLLFLLLAYLGQLHEIYLSYLEPPFGAGKAVHILIALLVLALVSSSLYYANYALGTIRIDVIYSQTGNYSSDVRLKLLRGIVGVLTALAPWFGLALGVHNGAARMSRDIDRLSTALAPLMGDNQAIHQRLAAIAMVGPRMQLAACLALLIGAALLYLLYRTRQNARFRASVVGMGIAMLVLVLIVPSLLARLAGTFPQPLGWLRLEAVPYYRSIGPLSMILIVALSLIAILTVLAYLSGQIGFPLVPVAFALAILAALMHWPAEAFVWSMLIAFLLIAVLGLLSHRRHLALLAALLASFTLSVAGQLAGNAVPPAERDAAQPAHQALADGFSSWLADHQAERDAYVRAKGSRYPVFIIAAQGGGIYAAAAAAAFLAQLQDRCPDFARHIFLISGVSGGAVGASIFQSMVQAQQPAQRNCGAAAGAEASFMAKTSAVVEDDHLSPLLGMLPADLLGLQRDRSLGLELGFAASVKQYGGVTAMGDPFANHWRPAGAAPALLLNATWVETGYRVAFAPFVLGGMRDGTLYAFDDKSLAIGGAADLSLAGAAVVSARFPGVVPAFSFDRPILRNGEKVMARWNFVDGGYSDESGSATALEIYKAIERIAEAQGVDLRLILLTNARPEPNFDDIEGTVARDLLAPALTVLKVRDLLSRQAIMRTISEVERDPERALALQQKRSPAQLGRVEDWKAAVIELDHEAFTLALGWKMSSSTHAIVSLLLGRDEFCRGIAQGGEAGAGANPSAEQNKGSSLQISTKTIRANSCVVHAIGKLVDLAP